MPGGTSTVSRSVCGCAVSYLKTNARSSNVCEREGGLYSSKRARGRLVFLSDEGPTVCRTIAVPTSLRRESRRHIACCASCDFAGVCSTLRGPVIRHVGLQTMSELHFPCSGP